MSRIRLLFVASLLFLLTLLPTGCGDRLPPKTDINSAKEALTTALEAWKDGQEIWNERPDICQSVRLRPQDDHCDLERADILLERQVAVDCHERVEMLRGQRQEFAILDRRPTHLACGVDVMTQEIRRGEQVIEYTG